MGGETQQRDFHQRADFPRAVLVGNSQAAVLSVFFLGNIRYVTDTYVLKIITNNIFHYFPNAPHGGAEVPRSPISKAQGPGHPKPPGCTSRPWLWRMQPWAASTKASACTPKRPGEANAFPCTSGELALFYKPASRLQLLGKVPLAPAVPFGAGWGRSLSRRERTHPR